MSEIPTKTRAAIRQRDNGQCIACGGPGTDLHHRQRRREGGHGLEILVLLCRTCHNRVHANPKWAREHGLIVSVYVTDVAAVPVRAYWGWVLLHRDGTITHLQNRDVEPGDPPQRIYHADQIETLVVTADQITATSIAWPTYDTPQDAIRAFEEGETDGDD